MGGVLILVWGVAPMKLEAVLGESWLVLGAVQQ